MDLSLWYGNDLSPSASGDLLTVEGPVRGQQRILRRLMTNPGDYIWHPDYGAGLPQYIGQPVDADTIRGLVRQQVELEASVAKEPPPEVLVRIDPGGTMFVRIIYIDADTGQPTTLSFNVDE